MMGIQELEILIYEQALQNAIAYEHRCLRRAEEAEREFEASKAEVHAAKITLDRARKQYLSRVPA